MNSFGEVGGYFELELPMVFKEYYHSLFDLNSARNCLRFVIRYRKIKVLYVPYYICKSVIDTIEEEECKICFYSIDKNFYPTQEIFGEDWILYVNYFGINYKNVKRICRKYKNVIIDNSQSFFSPYQKDKDVFYSPRKFFGVSDGGYLHTNIKADENLVRDESSYRSEYLLKGVDLGRSAGYEGFQKNEKAISGLPLKRMSVLTKRLLQSVNYKRAAKRRIENFNWIHSKLAHLNEMKFKLGVGEVPMVYPFLQKNLGIREQLIKNKIYVPTYWPEMEQWIPVDSFEAYLQKNLIPLPIDQRIDRVMLRRYVDLVMHIIEESRVFIRPLRAEDAKVSWKWRNDKDIWKLTGSKPDKKITLSIEQKWISEVLNRNNEKRFAICVGGGKKYIGNVQLTHIVNGTAQFHIFIGDKKYWGRGVGTQATQQIVRYAFEELNLKEVYLFVRKEHLAAISVYRKCGFSELVGGDWENSKMVIRNKNG